MGVAYCPAMLLGGWVGAHRVKVDAPYIIWVDALITLDKEI